MFAEAVIWQNRSAYRTAVAKIAGRGAEPGSKRRQRDGVVAGYWQRYCSKNDTVGFFGPLAWGTIRDEGPAVAVGSRGLVAEREVHFESWCLEALAQKLDPSLVVPSNRRPELELRPQLEALGNARGLQALDRLEAARASVAEAIDGAALLAALDAFDACLEELAGAPPAPSEEGAEGGRTPRRGRPPGRGAHGWRERRARDDPPPTHRWKGTATGGHSQIESQTKSTDTNLTSAPDGTPAHSQFANDL